MVLDWDIIFAHVAHLGCSQCGLGRAARHWGCERVFGGVDGGFQFEGLISLTAQVRDVRLFIVFHVDQRRGESRNLRFFGDNQRDRLAAEHDPVIVEGPKWRSFGSHLVLIGAVSIRHARPIFMAEHVDHASDAQRLAGIDARDAALGDAGCDHAAMGEAGAKGEAGYVVLGGVLRRARHLGAAIDARRGGADVKCHGPARSIFLRNGTSEVSRVVACVSEAAPSDCSDRSRAAKDSAAADIAHHASLRFRRRGL